ncbi:MAG: hypothetical protein H0X66_10620 [Verrucomicrobia bacterium]|nr:hypothetical protein [Verrucomicrobiota bacterium]
MHRLIPLLGLLLASCTDPSLIQQVPSQAARSDAVWLCDIDVSGPTVRYKAKQAIKTNATSVQFTQGQIVPVSGPATEAGTQYGDEAFIFLARPTSTRPVSADFILIVHDGVAGEGMSREEVIKTIQETQNKKRNVDNSE